MTRRGGGREEGRGEGEEGSGEQGEGGYKGVRRERGRGG